MGLDANSVPAHTQLGLVLLDRGGNQDALRSLDRAIELDPEYHRAYGNRSLSHSRAGEPRLALADYAKAIEIGPTAWLTATGPRYTSSRAT